MLPDLAQYTVDWELLGNLGDFCPTIYGGFSVCVDAVGDVGDPSVGDGLDECEEGLRLGARYRMSTSQGAVLSYFIYGFARLREYLYPSPTT